MDLNRVADVKTYSADDMPTYPARFLLQHTVIKGIQVGSVGGVLLFPFVSLVKKYGLAKSWRYTLPVSASVGVAGALSLLYYAHTQGKLDIAGVDDRAYRIKHNEGQNRVDLYSGIGAVSGAALGVVGSKTVIFSALAGSLTGVAAGVAFYALDKNKEYHQQVEQVVSSVKAYIPKF